jgi:hypothetical protein
MNDDVMCNRFIIGMARVTLRTHAMSHRVKSINILTIVELHNFYSRLVLDSQHMGRADQSQDDTSGNEHGRSNGKRPRNNSDGNGNVNGGKKHRPDKL